MSDNKETDINIYTNNERYPDGVNGIPRVGKTCDPKDDMMQGCRHTVFAGSSGASVIYKTGDWGSSTNAVPFIDYKALFEKYVKLILEREGWDYSDYTDGGNFTEAETAEIKRIHKEWCNE